MGQGESSLLVERYALDTGKLIAQQGVDSTLRALCADRMESIWRWYSLCGPEDMEHP